MIFNQDQEAIKDSLNRIMKEVKEVKKDGRAIKDSQIRISEENIEMYNSKSRVYLNNFCVTFLLYHSNLENIQVYGIL